MTSLQKGDQAPNFSAKDQDGNLHTLADYKGKKLVVFFIQKPIHQVALLKPAI